MGKKGYFWFFKDKHSVKAVCFDGLCSCFWSKRLDFRVALTKQIDLHSSPLLTQVNVWLCFNYMAIRKILTFLYMSKMSLAINP